MLAESSEFELQRYVAFSYDRLIDAQYKQSDPQKLEVVLKNQGKAVAAYQSLRALAISPEDRDYVDMQVEMAKTRQKHFAKLLELKVEMPQRLKFTKEESGNPVVNVHGKLDGDFKWNDYALEMMKGKRYQIDLSTTDKTLDPFLRLFSADGGRIDVDDDGGGYPNAKIVFPCSEDGVYWIVATAAGAHPNDPERNKKTGEFLLRIQEIEQKK